MHACVLLQIPRLPDGRQRYRVLRQVGVRRASQSGDDELFTVRLVEIEMRDVSGSGVSI
jgi:hypothetical protein